MFSCIFSEGVSNTDGHLPGTQSTQTRHDGNVVEAQVVLAMLFQMHPSHVAS